MGTLLSKLSYLGVVLAVVGISDSASARLKASQINWSKSTQDTGTQTLPIKECSCETAADKKIKEEVQKAEEDVITEITTSSTELSALVSPLPEDKYLNSVAKTRNDDLGKNLDRYQELRDNIQALVKSSNDGISKETKESLGKLVLVLDKMIKKAQYGKRNNNVASRANHTSYIKLERKVAGELKSCTCTQAARNALRNTLKSLNDAENQEAEQWFRDLAAIFEAVTPDSYKEMIQPLPNKDFAEHLKLYKSIEERMNDAVNHEGVPADIKENFNKYLPVVGLMIKKAERGSKGKN
jgi:hypothetical protein